MSELVGARTYYFKTKKLIVPSRARCPFYFAEYCRRLATQHICIHFVLRSQLLYILSFRTKNGSTGSGIWALVTLSFIPWLPFLKQQLVVSQELRVRTPSWEHVVSTPQLKAVPLVFGKFLFGVLDLEINAVYLILGCTHHTHRADLHSAFFIFENKNFSASVLADITDHDSLGIFFFHSGFTSQKGCYFRYPH